MTYEDFNVPKEQPECKESQKTCMRSGWGEARTAWGQERSNDILKELRSFSDWSEKGPKRANTGVGGGTKQEIFFRPRGTKNVHCRPFSTP